MPVPARPHRQTDDPLDEVLRPPPDETPEQRDLRLAREEHANQISLAIDADIKAERHARRKKRIVRLLLLGQSESGKSTTLRQFQRLYTPTAFREERVLWRAVIQLNIVRSIRIILDTLSSTTSQVSPRTSPFSSPRSRARSISRTRPPLAPIDIPPLPSSDFSNQEFAPNGNGETSHFGDNRGEFGGESDGEYDSDGPASRSNPSSATLNNSPLEALKSRLLPLRHIEALLIAKLVPPNEDEATHLVGPHTYPPGQAQYNPGGNSFRTQEIFVRPGAAWKGAMSKARVNYPSYNGSDEPHPTPDTGRPTSAGNTGLETPDEPQEVLNQCRKDMMLLWNDEVVREILKRKKVRLEELPGFFLNDLERVTALNYMPNDDDVLKARLKTVGVSEYKFEMEVTAGRDSGTEWRIVDVGGSRSQVTTWAPFFDDVDAIIFLAPISGFDQVLLEDRSVNRLEDSVLLWKAVCSNKLLANVDLVLFLNKCDILESKLKSGIKLSRYVRSYGDRENDLDSVSKYLRGKFSAIHREYSPNPRKFYAFCTSVTDTATTAGIIASVRDMVIRQHLKQSKLL
ncbi:guanine nucleotide binding protein, alpha subunit [Collybia nuda]|uniref:Guanine nucleotide binding protein, alpha subunit n=1 Tax=Collybia nuda TaxID=64659 RepID=A0A9P5XW61_9AGAR|nr:guanine nucleotide binding protein, alpha subunit [Collybia nuda]